MVQASDTIIVDADALIALFDTDDPLNHDAFSLLDTIEDAQATLLYPATAIAEAVTTLQRKLSKPAIAAQVMERIHAHELLIERVDQAVIDEAAALFRPQGSKQNTFFDAIVAAVARRHDARAIFSFDGWYTKVGLMLVGAV